MASILTFDLGTSYFKACLFSREGRLLALEHAAPPLRREKPGWWELDDHGLAETVRTLIQRLRTNAPEASAQIRAVSYATQANSFLLVDEAGEALTPLILWPDVRAAGLVDRLAPLGGPDLYPATGITSLTEQYAPAKLIWLREHMPEAWRRAAGVQFINARFERLLGGPGHAEAAVAALTGACDAHSLLWRTDALEKAGIPGHWLPPVRRPGFDGGELDPARARAIGLPRGVRAVVGCLDQLAGAIGAGNVSAGQLSETTGTVLAAVRCALGFNPRPREGVVQSPAPELGRFYEMCWSETSANLLEAYRQSLPAGDRPSFAELDAMAASVPPGAQGLRVNPGANLSQQDDLFAGLEKHHGRGHAVRAILEAVAFALAGQVGALSGGDRPEMIRSVGGAARSDLWLQIKADVLGLPMQPTTCPEPTSLGAAILAESALAGAAIADVAGAWVHTRPVKEPDQAAHRRYREISGL